MRLFQKNLSISSSATVSSPSPLGSPGGLIVLAEGFFFDAYKINSGHLDLPPVQVPLVELEVVIPRPLGTEVGDIIAMIKVQVTVKKVPNHPVM
jgi:hypothetical protein